MRYYMEALRNYANFSGRATRSEYWVFMTINFVITWILVWLDYVIFTNLLGLPGIRPFSGIYGLAMFIPSIAVIVRRLHDIGKRGTWYFIVLIPLIGWIWFIVLMCMASEEKENKYGLIRLI